MAENSQLAKSSCDVSVAIQNVHTSIEKKQTLPWTMLEKKILRVPHQLLKVNEKAYEPYVISIGPYHRGKDHLKEMEGQKVHCLNGLLQKTNQNVEIYLSAIGNVVEEARNCYSEPINLSMEEFVEMMVLDGCFIILFLTGNLGDSFCHSGLIYSSILHDLVLVENQLPFFVLRKLLDKIPCFNLVGSTNPKSLFIRQLLARFKGSLPGLRANRTYDDDSMKNVKHIGQLLLSNWYPSDKAMDEYHKRPTDGEWNFIRSAAELREAGIVFEKVDTRGNEESILFEIKFEQGTLKMPAVRICDSTERFFRNLIVCEQLDIRNKRFFTDYVVLMNSLINSGKDVGLLSKSGIIDNWLGDDEEVAVLFNRLGDYATFCPADFFYAQLFKDVDEYYKTTWNAWKATLKHNYFNTPWALISFLAATLLLLLTMLQTIFTILTLQS